MESLLVIITKKKTNLFCIKSPSEHAAHLRVVQARGGAAQVLHDGPGDVDRLVLLGVVADLEAVARDDLATKSRY